jgi:hypothetical protein
VRQVELAGIAAGRSPGADQRAVGGEAVDAGIAATVGDVYVAIGRLGDVGHAVERLAAEQHRTLADLEAGARGAPGLAQHLLEIARGVEDAHRVVAVVGAVDAIVAIDVHAVR